MKRLAAGAIGFLACLATPAHGQQPGLGAKDFGGFRNVLAVGQGEGVNAAELGAYLAAGTAPRSFTNQLPMYRDLLYAEPRLTDADLGQFFKPADLGVPTGEIDSIDSPRAGVTIVRDRAFQVPQVYGATREDVMFGAGYAQAQDRMFLMDVLRHTGRGDLSAFVGPGTNDGNVEADLLHLMRADYTEEELAAMADQRLRELGPEGEAIRRDLEAFVAGINHFIAEARSNPELMPAEYAAIGKGLEDWKMTDTAAAITLVGARFGLGGGSEAENAGLLALARERFGGKRARKVFHDILQRDDPEAPVTIRRRFAFDDPGRPRSRQVARLDARSLKPAQLIESDSGAPGEPAPGILASGLKLPTRMSNAVLVAAKRSKSGKPLAFMGPQIGFYTPALFSELALHGPGFSVRGGVFPGVAPYVLIGRGPDFAWSATSAGTDNVDEFVSALCDETHYRYKGRCVPIQVQHRTLQIDPTPTAPTQQPRTITLRLERTVHGPVQGRATVAGKPVIISLARSTYQHELASALAFKRLNLNEVDDAATFKGAMATINFVFNWFYADDRDIAYLQSGWFPRRARGTDPGLPAWGDGRADWQGFDPASFRSRRLPASRLPQAVNPRRGYFANWNNKQAPGWRAADDVRYYGSVHRQEILARPLRGLLAAGKATLVDLVKIVEAGATVDLRGRELWPVIERVIGRQTGDMAPYVELLDAWHREGAHRRDMDRDNVYEHSAAVALMDAWFSRLVQGVFEPQMGSELYDAVVSAVGLDDHPSQFDPTGDAIEGSVWGSGLLGQLDKDLRTLAGARVRAPLSQRYCGEGSLKRCRSVLLDSLRSAVEAVSNAQGPDTTKWVVNATCEPNPDGSSPCDQIDFTAAGGVESEPLPLQNRPTFQQLVEAGGHRPR